jgi:hypothetical protein
MVAARALDTRLFDTTADALAAYDAGDSPR